MPGPFSKRLMLAAVACLAAAALAVAADDAKPAATVLSGVVVNGEGRPVAEARVYWQAADGRSPHFLRTDAEGRFRSKPVHAGLCEVRAQAEGLWSEWAHNVLVRPGAGAELTLLLVRKTPPGKGEN